MFTDDPGPDILPVQWMDPQLWKLLEVSYEAWMDSGISHAALRGSDKVTSGSPPAQKPACYLKGEFLRAS